MMKPILLSLFIATLFSSCHFITGERIEGNGHVVSQNRNFGNFTGLDVTGAVDVYIKQDASFSVTVETDENLQDYIITELHGNILHIGQAQNTSIQSTRLKVYISAPAYEKFEVSGASKIYGQNDISSDGTVRIDLSGASGIVLNLHAAQVQAGLSGASHAELSGQTKDANLEGTGSSDFSCYNLQAENVDVDISGASNAEVSAAAQLDVEVSGAGNIRYKGNPKVEQNISGAGSVKKVD